MLKLIKSLFVATCSLFIFSGCVSLYDPVKIPEFSKTIKVFPSSKNVSTMTETPAGDYLVDDSQVFLAGKERAGNLFGAMGIMVDRSLNGEKRATANAKLNVKFHSILSELIENTENLSTFKFQTVKNAKSADLILLPSVRLVKDPNSTTYPEFRITVRFIDPSSKEEVSKNYYYFGTQYHPLVGVNSWADNNAEILDENARSAFRFLLEIIASDARGDYQGFASLKEYRYIYYKHPSMSEYGKVAVVDEYPNHVLGAAVHQDKIIHFSVTLIPKELIDISGNR